MKMKTSLANLHAAYYRHPLGWIREQLSAELFVNRSTVGPIGVGGRVLFPRDGERAGMFICLHVNKHCGGGAKRPLLDFLSSETVSLAASSAHGVTAHTRLYRTLMGRRTFWFPTVFG